MSSKEKANRIKTIEFSFFWEIIVFDFIVFLFAQDHSRAWHAKLVFERADSRLQLKKLVHDVQLQYQRATVCCVRTVHTILYLIYTVCDIVIVGNMIRSWHYIQYVCMHARNDRGYWIYSLLYFSFRFFYIKCRLNFIAFAAETTYDVMNVFLREIHQYYSILILLLIKNKRNPILLNKSSSFPYFNYERLDWPPKSS